MMGQPEYRTMYGKRRTARFMPKRRDNLVPEVVPLIGEVAEWHWIGRSNDDEPYPGQNRWEPQDVRWEYRWAPDEDLEDVKPEPEGSVTQRLMGAGDAPAVISCACRCGVESRYATVIGGPPAGIDPEPPAGVG